MKTIKKVVILPLCCLVSLAMLAGNQTNQKDIEEASRTFVLSTQKTNRSLLSFYDTSFDYSGGTTYFYGKTNVSKKDFYGIGYLSNDNSTIVQDYTVSLDGDTGFCSVSSFASDENETYSFYAEGKIEYTAAFDDYIVSSNGESKLMSTILSEQTYVFTTAVLDDPLNYLGGGVGSVAQYAAGAGMGSLVILTYIALSNWIRSWFEADETVETYSFTFENTKYYCIPMSYVEVSQLAQNEYRLAVVDYILGNVYIGITPVSEQIAVDALSTTVVIAQRPGKNGVMRNIFIDTWTYEESNALTAAYQAMVVRYPAHCWEYPLLDLPNYSSSQQRYFHYHPVYESATTYPDLPHALFGLPLTA